MANSFILHLLEGRRTEEILEVLDISVAFTIRNRSFLLLGWGVCEDLEM